MNAIDIDGLHLEARGRPLLSGFSLALGQGQRCTITGASGTGKSTILRCLLGFAQPAAGRIEVLGHKLDAPGAWAVRRQVAWVAQEPELGDATAREAIEAPFRFRANRGQEAEPAHVAALAERLGLEAELLDQPAAKLSGGEKQRVALMAALLLRRPVLLVDEVTSALDADSRAAVVTCLRELEGTTILSVAHDPAAFDLGGAVVSLDPEERRP